MKSMKVKSLLLALGLSMVVGKSFAISFKVDGINYVANADTAIVKGYSEIPENGELKLAATVTYGGKDYRVTTVQGSAFLSCTDIKKLTVPASVKYIQSGAFENCVNMSNLVLEQGDDVLDAASDAFKNCEIEEATIGRELKTSILNGSKSLQKVTLLNNVKTIVANAFSNCGNLSEINLDNVEVINSSAFCNCRNLNSVNMASVKELKVESFLCSGIVELALPSSLVEISSRCFENCQSLERVNILGSIKEISQSCFRGCNKLSTIEYPASVKTICYDAFRDCVALKTVSWNNVSLIQSEAFQNTGLESIQLPKSVEEIQFDAFRECAKLKSVDLSETSIINLSGFYRCKSLSDIKLPVCLEEIGSHCFADCPSFENIVFPISLREISCCAFSGAENLKRIDLSGTKVHELSNSCFSYCKSLESVILNENTDSIGSGAFYDCQNLSSITNTNNIIIVKTDAFEGTKLFKVSTAGPVMIGSAMYKYNGEINEKEYAVPAGVTCLCDGVFANQQFQVIKLNEGLKYVGKGVFDNCTNLVSLTIPSSVDIFGGSKNCPKISFLTINDGDNDLTLGELSGASIRKMYLGRKLYTGEWLEDLENLTVGKSVTAFTSLLASNCKLDELYIEDSPVVLDLSNLTIANVSSLYLGRPISLNKEKYQEFSNLQQLTIGKNISVIPENFAPGNKLTELVIPSNIKEIGREAFSTSCLLRKVELNEGLETIKDGAFCFRNDTPIDSLVFPSTLKTIDFFSCMSVKCKKLILNEGVQNIGHMAFYALDTDSLILPSTCKIDYQCFEFSKIKYLDASKYHGNFKSAFAYNENLEKVIMPKEGMTVLCENDFWGCKSLKSIELPNTIDSISHSVFGGTQIMEVHIPKSVRVIADRMFCTTSGGPMYFKPIVYIDGNFWNQPIRLNSTFGVELQKVDVSRNFSYCFYATVNGENEQEWNTSKIMMDSLVIRDINTFDIMTKAGSRFIPTTAICLSPHLTSCDLWKPTSGKIFVLPGSQLPKEDVSYMYMVNKLDYVQDADGNVLFDGVNNMPYDITPVFYQDDKEVELKEAGVYDLSMKIAGTSFDGIYPTGLKVTVASTSGLNRVISDTDSQHCPIYNMNGQRVDDGYKGIVIQNGKKRIAK